MELDIIYNEDCIEGMKKIPNKSIDCIICDLPYGTTRNKWDSIIPFDKLWEEYERIIKDNGAIVLFSQQPFTAALVMSNPKLFKYEWIWEKESGTGFLNAKRAPLKIHENILVFYKSLPTYNPQMTEGKPYKCKSGKQKNASYDVAHMHDVVTENKGERYPITTIKFARDKEKIHPTQKPVDLIRYLIKTYSNPNEIILDNCMGSATTAIACLLENRHYIGFELSKEYFDKGNDRIEKTKKELLK